MSPFADLSLASLHLLRPQWLWALLALPLLLGLSRVQRRRASVWRENVDAHLLPHLLVERGGARVRWGAWVAGLAYVLAVFALAGPSWRQTPQPLWQSRTPLVVAVDLSGAALAADLPPSRLAQSRAKLSTLLRERQGGQVALVAFADDAFTVAPLTEDAANVALFLDALSPDVMPVDGQRADRAIEWSVRLLKQSGFDRGRILLMTDHAGDGGKQAASAAAKQGFRVDVLGVGGEAGAPYRRGDGTFANARLDEGSLRGLASAGNGRYTRIASDDGDLRALGVLDPTDADDATRVDGKRGHAWQDEGYWLLPPLMLLALFAFRRRATGLAIVALCVLWTPVRAADMWRRADQVEHAHIVQGNEAFRRGDFNAAAQAYQSADSADAHYNRGNALAKAGQYPQAIAAYDEALKRQPDMPDAIANKRAVEAAMKRKPPQGGGQSKEPQKQDQKADQKPQSGPQQQDKKSQQDSKQQDSQSQDSKQQQNQPQSEPSPADAQKQRDADAAQRQRMQQALQQQGQSKPEQQDRSRNETPQQREQRLANEGWLRRVPDDPGGLLREKFRIEHERRSTGGEGNE